MNVSLREITPENFNECINLKVADDQIKFVASNVYSIAQSKIYPSRLPFAVYDGNQMVGFVMYGHNLDERRFYLGRLMIDEKFQSKGYGKAVTLEVIERFNQNEDCKEIYLCCSPENTKATRLYRNVGFEQTGEISDGEILMRFKINN